MAKLTEKQIKSLKKLNARDEFMAVYKDCPQGSYIDPTVTLFDIYTRVCAGFEIYSMLRTVDYSMCRAMFKLIDWKLGQKPNTLEKIREKAL